jgi:lathosterol oxidase
MNAWLNSILFTPRFAATAAALLNHNVEGAHYALCYLRNFIGAMIVYYGTAGIFHFFCYVHPMSDEIFAKRTRPSRAIMWDQIRLAQLSMILYVLLPVADEYLIERGWTRAYYMVSEIGGWHWYAAYTLLYFCLVEIGIYWMHRTLHTNKFLYKHVHLIHHKYNAPHTLTPWASIAFHPLDGILQASPYVLAIFVVPCHYPTHFGLLFFTAIWATYIHDAMDFNVWPIMGSKYHTIHHTHYIYNYGQVFVFCDRLWGTFREPSGPTGVTSSAAGDKNGGTQAPRSRPVTSRVGGGKSKRS